MAEAQIARRLEINGIVQGVGFRPFVYQLAHRHRLRGDVANTSAGVIIRIEGDRQSVEAFAAELAQNPPPLAHITEIRQQEVPPNGFSEFSIVASRGDAAMSTLISPDVSICQDCLAELFDPQDRRYRYPFINCTNCGPRYTIIEDIPYDRPKTSMKHFRMCPQCQAEYDDPTDRRFHAQPNACPVCGPQVTLRDRQGRVIDTADPIAEIARRLKQGAVAAIKGLGGFHLAADPTNEAAVQRLRRRKHREEKPLALMAADLKAVGGFAQFTAEEARLLQSAQRPIVLLRKKHPNAIAVSVAPRNGYFGVMLPYTPLHYLLLDCGLNALVMTSGNLSEEPIAIDNAEALLRLGEIADDFLMHDRDIYLRSDDSIVRRAAGGTRPLRRSRGFVPVPVFLKAKQPPVLAVGAELKNTVCLTRNDQAFVSQHIGDLENAATYDFFCMTVAHMQRILAIAPQTVAHDLHPDYLSTRWALEQTGWSSAAVQHHHAHIVSVLAEHRIDGPVIGLSFDGTGYGTDGAIWGGEVLIAETGSFQRAAHLAYVPMPGAAAAVRQPWRMALAHLFEAFGDSMWELDLAPLQAVEGAQRQVLQQVIERGINAPRTSSLGRLFDAVAAIVGLRGTVAFEGQAAMELEMAAGGSFQGAPVYDMRWSADDPIRIATAPIIRGVVGDVLAGRAAAEVSARFHATLVTLFADLCARLRRETGLQRIALSGGVFQNALLLEGLTAALEADRFQVFANRQVPTNDGGICLGQAVAAAAMLD